MNFDPAARLLEVSVRDLADTDGFRRIGFERGEGWNRLGLGAELHARVLRERCAARPGYRREVAVQAEWKIGEWTARVTGRLDGVVNEDGLWLVEEFKSAYLPSDEAPRGGAAFERHQRQLLIYCHIWRRLAEGPVSGALVYVDLGTGAEKSVAVTYEQDEVERELANRLRKLLAQCEAELALRARKAQAAAAMTFPHEDPRPGQKIMMHSVSAALETGGHLLAEAPTGSGKTAASLYPALRHTLSSGRQAVFLTAKTLQQKMAVGVLEKLNRDGAFRSIQLRAKEKMCANDRVLCHEDFCPFAKNYPEKMEKSRLLERLRETRSHFDPDDVFAEARREQVCPFEVQLELAHRADAVVGDYNYVFDPGAALSHLDADGLGEAVLLVDEAHNLPDRARKIFSPELLEEAFRAVAGRLLLQPGELFESLTRTVESAADLLREMITSIEAPATIAETEPPADSIRTLWKQWEPLFVRYLSWKREMKVAEAEDPTVDLHFAWQRFLAILHLYGPGFACVIEKRPGGARLALVCLDPARALAPVFRAASSAILFSATLSPLEAARRMLGLETERTATITLPPAFPRENRKVIIVPRVRTAYRDRAANYPTIAGLLGRMSDAQGGNALALFPSYQFLEEVARRLPVTQATVLVQRPNINAAEREGIFHHLSAPPPGGILLLAVMGGMYAEGVDYPGELLRGVYVISPALPQVSFERELLRRYFDSTDAAGFEFAYLQPGMTRVIQAAGRLIRTATDRGVIVLMCQRFLQPAYSRLLPRDWYDESPVELAARDPEAEVARFFGQRREHPNAELKMHHVK